MQSHEPAQGHESARTGGRPVAAALTGREVRRLTDIVLAAEAVGAPVPAIAAITPGLTFEDAFRIRQEAFARRLATVSAIAAVVALPDSPVRFYTDRMVRRESAQEETGQLQLTAQPVVLFRVDDPSGPRATLGIEVRRIRAPHPARQEWHTGHDDVCTNGGAHLLIVPDPDRSDVTGDPAIERIAWSAGDDHILRTSHRATQSESVGAAISRALDELSAETPERDPELEVGVEPLAPAVLLAAGTCATLRFTTASAKDSDLPPVERDHHLSFAVHQQSCQNGK
ncbi:hypothetical protein [Gordonia sp. NPDC003376]